MAGSGSWTASGGANAVRLEYYLNNVLYTSEERSGTSGTWYFSTQGLACGSYSLLVKAFPMVIDSGGNRTTCWSAPRSTSQNLSESCPYTWWSHGTEWCSDWFGASCYEANPQPECPPNPAGQSCSPQGSYCYHVLNNQQFEFYNCG